MVPGPELGQTRWGVWSSYVRCPLGKKVTGFRLKVEEEQGQGSDNTALNGIQFNCQGDTTSGKMGFRLGTWTSWKTCNDDEYVTEFDLKGMKEVGSQRDDYGATNVRIRCSGGDERVGDGLPVGQWVGYTSCPVGTFICGGRALIEGKQGKRDDTALNRLQMGCCKQG